MDSKRNALLVRMGPYDMTQAIPRAASTLQEMGYNIIILAMDIQNNKPDTEQFNGWKIIWYHHKYKSGNKLSFLWAWLCWWVWVVKHIRKGNYHLVQASNLESIVPCVLAKYTNTKTGIPNNIKIVAFILFTFNYWNVSLSWYIYRLVVVIHSFDHHVFDVVRVSTDSF